MIEPEFFAPPNGEFGLTAKTKALIKAAQERENPNHIEYDCLNKTQRPWSKKQ